MSHIHGVAHGGDGPRPDLLLYGFNAKWLGAQRFARSQCATPEHRVTRSAQWTALLPPVTVRDAMESRRGS